MSAWNEWKVQEPVSLLTPAPAATSASTWGYRAVQVLVVLVAAFIAARLHTKHGVPAPAGAAGVALTFAAVLWVGARQRGRGYAIRAQLLHDESDHAWRVLVSSEPGPVLQQSQIHGATATLHLVGPHEDIVHSIPVPLADGGSSYTGALDLNGLAPQSSTFEHHMARLAVSMDHTYGKREGVVDVTHWLAPVMRRKGLAMPAPAGEGCPVCDTPLHARGLGHACDTCGLRTFPESALARVFQADKAAVVAATNERRAQRRASHACPLCAHETRAILAPDLPGMPQFSACLSCGSASFSAAQWARQGLTMDGMPAGDSA